MTLISLISSLDGLAHQHPMLGTLADLGLKSLLVLACGFIALAFLHKVSASTKSMTWRMVFAVLFALPALHAFIPDVHIAVHSYNDSGSTSSPDSPLYAQSLLTVIAAFYILITTLLIGYLIAGLLKICSIGQQASALEQARIHGILKTAIEKNGSTQSVALLVSDKVSSPVTWGFYKHRIIFPTAVSTWSDTLIEQVIGHELGHIQRNDWVQQLASRIVICFYWPNPLVFIAAKKMSLETEKACDDFAIDDTGCRISYAENLLWLTQHLKSSSNSKLAMKFVGAKSVLLERIKYILSEDKRQHAIDRESCLPGIFVAILFAAPFSAANFTLEEHVLSPKLQVFTIQYFSNNSLQSKDFQNELKVYTANQ